MQAVREEITRAARDYMAACNKAAEALEEPAAEEGHMKVRVVSSFCLGRGRDVYEGDELRAPGDLSLPAAREKIAQRLLVEIPDPVQPSTADPAPATRDPEAVHADPEVTTPATKPTSSRKKTSRKGERGGSS